MKPRAAGGYFAFIALTVALAAAEFSPPSPETIRAALGALEDESRVWQRLLTPDAAFAPIRTPASGDWLAVHAEPGQTVAEFRTGQFNRPDAARRVIYLQPLGKFPADASPSLESLRLYAAAFFALDVKLLPPVPEDPRQFSPRRNRHTGRTQLLAGSVMEFLRARLPADAFCMLGVTMVDLYPADSWNFVFGQASLSERVGVYSFARYDPEFFGRARGPDFRAHLLRESCKVLAHETAHMFGLAHCIYFDCVLNGANNAAESERQPQHFCPVCLRKLHLSVPFDPLERYAALEAFYRREDWRQEARWVEARLLRARTR